jgi:head-tail adaptor
MSTKCKYVQFTKSKLCLGDLKHKITLFKKAIVTPTYQSVNLVDYSFDYEEMGSVWAAIVTIKGDAIADSVAKEDLPTHKFYIKYIGDLSTENWILFKDYRYEILRIINVNEDDVYLEIHALKTGLETQQASKV